METVELLKDALIIAQFIAEKLPEGEFKDDIKFDIFVLSNKVETQSLPSLIHE